MDLVSDKSILFTLLFHLGEKFTGVRRRPFLAEECTDVRSCKRWRREIGMGHKHVLYFFSILL